MPDPGGFNGPLRHNPVNPRYFTDGSGRAIYLTGSHTWANLVEIQREGDPDFDYQGYLDFLEAHNHNFFRLWTWDHPQMGPWTEERITFDPMPYARTGPGLALDGKPKFDLSRYHPAYFERLRTRVEQAGERGIYVSVMLFEGWCVRFSVPASDAWLSHPYHAHNNINGVDGDPNQDGRGEVYSTDAPPSVLEFQAAYVRQVIDTVNDLDNVLYEVINEIPPGESNRRWHHRMIEFIHEYERSKPKQHPVGMTAVGHDEDNRRLFASSADWISPGYGPDMEYRYDPPDTGGTKVVIADTDHLWGHGGTYPWVWKCFARGLNPIFMDPWVPVPGALRAGYASAALNQRDYPDWALLRLNLGYTRRFAQRLDLNRAVPHPELASSRFCLAAPGEAYLVYVPDDAQVAVDLSAAAGDLAVEWFSPRSGATTHGEPIAGGALRRLTSPFGFDVVLFIHRTASRTHAGGSE